MREVAERILLAQSLDEKLQLAPELGTGVSDDAPGRAILVPDSPGRPDELKIVAKGVRADFPGVNRLDEDRERGKMMHFLANHELLAAELMALVLLKFPDAPKEYRRGVYEAMREEQMHTLMYLRRMKDCGIAFGELPVNHYFWRLIAPMETPMDFVTRLNLTFEQANLDFSKHYAELFRQVGDTGTAAVLEKIYLDEIGHVGHGVKWFRKWKAEGETDWHAFKRSLTFPLAPAKAKGIAPFNAEGRRLAGFDEDFISHLEVCEQSRGRTPVVHWFNPNAESCVAAQAAGRAFAPNKIESALENDLELLALAWCRPDDVVLVRHQPSNTHLARLQQAGVKLPEILEIEQLADRKLGGLRPWAWSPDASATLQRFAGDVPENHPWAWRQADPALWLSKEVGGRLEKSLGLTDGCGEFCYNEETALAAVRARRAGGDVLLKAAHACSGRRHKRLPAGNSEDELLPWLKNTLAAHGGVVVEPWLNRVMDFSVLYEMKAGAHPQGDAAKHSPGRQATHADFIGMTQMENDDAGRFLGTRIDPKWASGIDPEVAEFLFREAKVTQWYREKIPMELPKLLSGYTGPVGVDAMVFRRADGSLGLRHIVELNVRMTMGRVAFEFYKKLSPGRAGTFRILRKSTLSEASLSRLCSQDIHNRTMVINDPITAQAFIAVWVPCD
ncbi:MAG: ferritin-like domain-containing protein [Verrucomicrobiae bacterium]|nr:ferritin-like domain-containing protein [Verrucomicrobiae bacterium]